ncbi:MAG TPA: galactokinase [Anaerolineales bacterium]|nr:galactokinase [Anaerolineae bacterium]HIQ02136.1 galactokinase [Anaerolineales bacterium]
MQHTTHNSQLAAQAFQERFGYPPAIVVRAPGRVNLLGGHTDYNEGYVLPAAVDRAAWVAAAPVSEPVGRIVALDLGEEATFSLTPVPPPAGGWADYPRGVAWALAERGLELTGVEAALTSDVPVGAGLSSSAAVEVAFAWAWRTLSGFDLDRTELALACQQAENDYVGVRCGVMDQMAAVWGRAGHAILLDCRTLEVEPVRLPDGVAILVADTTVRRELASSEYNRRRRECEEAVRLLSRHLPSIRALRDVSPEEFARLQHHLPPPLRQRARHVIADNARVLEAVRALQAGDLERMGEAMRRCHRSLRDDYEVSSPELDLLAETAWNVPGCYGARLTGAGFGGCVVALVAETAVDDLAAALRRTYQARFRRRPTIYTCRAADGVT